ncbi:MAG: 1-acyl-sn-glycerol-3-phosphate acyltransferase [Tyzzerella sp.]|nr:1-acyl-sn-glycerol-3-phosphate acyltransferase [Tyzzerella sp.]
MKIKIVDKSYDEVLAMPKAKHHKPIKQHVIFRKLIQLLSCVDLWKTRFTYEKIGMDKLGKDEPCLILMNHSSFIDLKIAFTMLSSRPFNIVSTMDSFVGKSWLMRLIGCIPTKKFIADANLVRDMMYVVKKLKSSVLMYPEAGYSFDGTATTLPDSIGRCIKMLGVPVVMITTYGAFSHDPLYNNLKLRKVKISAKMEYVLSAEDVASKTVDELNAVVGACFSFDNFRWQHENRVRIKEKFRAEGLNRVLYKCPHCKTEGRMAGKDTKLVCRECGKIYELTEYGLMRAADGETEFAHIPDWYRWQRECVRQEIVEGQYSLNIPVDICIMMDTKRVYRVGEGVLRHNENGFHLSGCDGKLTYSQKPTSSYSLNSDYYWYEVGDVLSIGDSNMLYYCFPKGGGDIVTKTRLAAEEMYKIARANKKAARRV